MQRSTEQLTNRCSTATLEEVLDNQEGITSRTVSEKIMNVCKNTIRWVLLVDVLIVLSVIILLTILEFGSVPQQRIGFYCNDPKLSFKFMGDTVSITLLLAGCIVAPFVVMWLAEYMCHSADSYDISLGCAGSRAKQIWSWYGHYMAGIIGLTFLCDVMKTLIGEPRPHFLDTCKPREAQNCTHQYIEEYTCTNTIDSEWFVSDSSKSFPSGHSALSVFTTVFVVWYLQNRLPSRTFFLKPWLQCMLCLWAVICSLSRIIDNRHHWWDVLAGCIFGLTFSVLTVTVLCRAFHINRVGSHIYTEPIDNGQLNFNGKRHSNVKILHETTDLPEGCELKNASSNWKE
ncbi:phospholipid phosphatase 1 isoform X2 [Nomia melanderi]|uniref:phospholipid phosphatase 1 isoform X2 n=2 Tax=Nomia melanderi TaxID=2448451 RepID=UPI00130406F8|nr:phospholipid phosphatase 1-like isoform X1 [Nomia melanderi]